MTPPVEMFNINPGKFHAQAEVMAEALITAVGPEQAIGQTTALLEAMLVLVMHQETSMAEVNVMNIEKLLDHLKANVMEHKKCALDLNKLDPKKAS